MNFYVGRLPLQRSWQFSIDSQPHWVLVGGQVLRISWERTVSHKTAGVFKLCTLAHLTLLTPYSYSNPYYSSFIKCCYFLLVCIFITLNIITALIWLVTSSLNLFCGHQRSIENREESSTSLLMLPNGKFARSWNVLPTNH
jgi:hypothetical protein